MNSNLQFLRQGLKDIKTVGTFLRTAKNVSKSMVKHAAVSQCNTSGLRLQLWLCCLNHIAGLLPRSKPAGAAGHGR